MYTNKQIAIELGWQFIPNTLPDVQWQCPDGYSAGFCPPDFREDLDETLACWDAMAHPMRWRLRKFADVSGGGWCFENEIDNKRWSGTTASEAIVIAFMAERHVQSEGT